MDTNIDSRVESANGFYSKVPAVSVFFWIIKVLCTTVGETASDFLNVNLGWGLKGTSIVAGIVLAVVLFFQFKAKRYIPAVYWLTVVLISVFGTLVTDILTDSLGFPLEASTIIFGTALALTFVFWYFKEGTLSIHSIFTARREVFYWLAILFTFALGTAAGDLMAEKLGLGYLVTGLIVVGVIAAAAASWRMGLDAVLAFWISYILTRPLGASLGDYLSQSKVNGGLGLGATATSAVFLFAILAVVVYLAVTQRDQIAEPEAENARETSGTEVVWQVVVVAALLLIVGGSGYYVRREQLRDKAEASVSATAPLGDLTGFQTIAGDMLGMARAGDMTGAKTRADDLESAWDNGQAVMRPMNEEKWTLMDNAIDDVLNKARSGKTAPEMAASLESFINVMNTLGERSAAAHPVKPAAPVSGAKPLGDLSAFKKIAMDMQALVSAGDMSGAKTRAADLEAGWDNAQPKLQPMNPEKWKLMDSAIDDVLKKVRAAKPTEADCGAAIKSLLMVIDSLDGRK